MLLTVTTTYQPATDLSYLLHKHPDKVQKFNLAMGQVYVFYPQASDEICTAALLLDIDPIQLSRRPHTDHAGFALQPYVNDRLYVASSFMSVAIAKVYGTALNGRCKDRPELVNTPLPLQAKLAVLPVRGGKSLLCRLFEPLGYKVYLSRHPLDAQFPEWGDSPYYTVELTHIIPLQDLLSHLYVLIPVLDDDKHYWVGEDEIEKLLHRGESWLANHPEREQIALRYLKHRRHLTHAALAQLAANDEASPDFLGGDNDDAEETAVEEKIGLHQQRIQTVRDVLKNSGAERVLDLGCGEGKLLRLLLKEKQFSDIVGLDVSIRTLKMAADRLRLENLPERQRNRINLIQGSLMYRDERLSDYDAAAVVEVIEHLDPPRLAAFERVLFEFAQPQTIVITTPNQEYNKMWPDLPAGKFRHHDHRFEWTRVEFQAWANSMAERFGYTVQFAPIGPEDTVVGAPSQMGVFTR